MNSESGKIKVNIVNNRQWILGIIAGHLAELEDPRIEIAVNPKYDMAADMNYYMNWQGLVRAPKSAHDMIWFSHLCGPDEITALRKADTIVAKSEHGKKTLKSLGFNTRNVKIFEGIGAATDDFKKIAIGFAGRLCYKNRKNEKELLKLAKALDRRVFRFLLFGNDETLEAFLKELSQVADAKLYKRDIHSYFAQIDYYLQASWVEGGSMDIINAVNTGTPIVSRNIGFFHDFKTKEDYCYKEYRQLKSFFKKIEKPKVQKLDRAQVNTWDNFRKWHINLFKEIYGKQK